MKRQFILIIIILILFPALITAQMGTKQAGLRAGYRSGIFYQVTNEAGNAEMGYNALLTFNNNGIQLTGLRVVYETILTDISPDLVFAWGYGGHLGFVYTDNVLFLGERYSFTGRRFCPVFGVDGWLAAEYRFREVPINISLNLKPYVELTVPSFFRVMPFDLGISVSYIF